MIKHLLFIILAILPLPVMAQDAFPAPFGLTWGASAADLRALGFATHGNDTQGDEDKALRALTAVSVPKPWSRAEKYVALLFRDRLVKVVAQSESVTNDLGGTEGKTLYESVKKTLTEKYGVPSSHTETSGGKLYNDFDEFYQCLDYAGCGLYLSLYQYNGGVIAVRLEGESRGKGFLSVQYESPEFAKALATIKDGDAESDASAL